MQQHNEVHGEVASNSTSQQNVFCTFLLDGAGNSKNNAMRGGGAKDNTRTPKPVASQDNVQKCSRLKGARRKG
jgi:hypothetical protein